MGGRITFEPPLVSNCETYLGCDGKPPAGNYREGTRWRCDDCGRTWAVVEGRDRGVSETIWRLIDLDVAPATPKGDDR